MEKEYQKDQEAELIPPSSTRPSLETLSLEDLEKASFPNLEPELSYSSTECTACEIKVQRRKASIQTLISLAAFCTLLFIGASLPHWLAPASKKDSDIIIPKNKTILTCGKNTSTALANDCVLDLIDRTFVPRPCYIPSLTAQFLAIQDWVFYKYEIGDETVSIEELEVGGGPEEIWVPDEYHWWHCAYNWRKMHWAVLNGMGEDGERGKLVGKDTHLWKWRHTVHCSEVLGTRFSEKNKRAEFYVGFSDCEITA